MTPFDVVTRSYQFPTYIKPHALQLECINELSALNNSGEWLDMGTGKTFVSTACALFHKVTYGNVCVVIVPPLLISQWARWLRSITPALSVVEYKGTPTERKLKTLDADFVIVGVQIFKKEFDKFNNWYSLRQYSVIVDEATMVSNVSSDNHDKVFSFSIGRPTMLLSGTPANKPSDAYGLLKFTAPGTYRSIGQFENLHIEERDFWGAPVKYRGLDELAENLLINSKRVLFQDMYPMSEEPVFIPLNYDLEPTHLKLYRKLAEEQLLALPDGGKIDGTTAARLRHLLGQIVVNKGHFTGKPDDRSFATDLIEQRLMESGEKLVVFANYRMTVAHIASRLSKYKPGIINGDVTASQKEKSIQRFINDSDCRLIVIQFISGGKGLDGLQHVCNQALFIEPCVQPRDFHQCVARLNRMGQKRRVAVTLAIANGTVQVRQFKNLLINDGITNEVIRNATDLRKSIFGDADD